MKYKLIKQFPNGTFVLLATDMNGVEHIVTNSTQKLSDELTSMVHSSFPNVKQEADRLIEIIMPLQIIQVNEY